MSLINQMLKDLESRPKVNPEVLMSGLLSTAPDAKKNPLKYAISFALLMGCVAGISIFHSRSKVTIPVANSISTQNKAIFNPVKNDVMPLNATPAILTGITLQTQADMTYLRFLVNHNVLYRIDSENGNQKIMITLENTRLTTTLPTINYLKTAIQHISMHNQDGDLKITVVLNQGVDIQRLDFDNAKLPEMQLELQQKQAFDSGIPADLENKPDVIETNSGEFKKIFVDISAEQQYQQAISDPSKTMALLSAVVKQHPDYPLARKHLVGMLLEKNDFSTANYLLQEGLTLRPDYVPYFELKARMLVNQGKVNEALDLLEKMSPSLKEYPDYYALIAALYQRKGESVMAAKLYQQLINFKPDNGVWWMGLGIAFDSLGKHDQAVNAFLHAKNGDLSPELQAFLDSRTQIDS